MSATFWLLLIMAMLGFLWWVWGLAADAVSEDSPENPLPRPGSCGTMGTMSDTKRPMQHTPEPWITGMKDDGTILLGVTQALEGISDPAAFMRDAVEALKSIREIERWFDMACLDMGTPDCIEDAADAAAKALAHLPQQQETAE